MRQLTSLAGFDSIVRRYPDNGAVVTLDGRSFTYGELAARSTALAAALEARIPGERCAVLGRNRVEVVDAMLAAMRRGRANVQLATRGAPGQLASSMETAGATGLIYDEPLADTAGELVDELGLEVTIGIDGAGAGESYDAVLEGADPAAAPAAPQTYPPESANFFTSGTTSAPKGILVDQEQAWLGAIQPALEMGLTASDRALVCTPWYHMVTTEAWMLPHLLVGATLVIQPAFDPEETLRAIDEHEVTGLLAVPTQLELLVESQEDLGVDLRTLEYIRTGGAIVPERLIAAVRETLDADVFNTYGLTEGVANLTFAYPEEQADHPGTIGKASFLWDIRVVEPADPPAKPNPEDRVEPGELGEIIGRSLQMSREYLDRPEETEALLVDGWLRTGDVARVDEDGYPVIIDRIDNMLVSGGENVYPEEVQRALEDHAAVKAAGVVGLPDDTWGQLVAAAVVTTGDVAEEALEEHCKSHGSLADFKRPRRYVFVDELPRSATGTLLRGEVRELFER